MKTLSLIVPHYTEPWEIGEKLFSMLRLQRGAAFDETEVILVNDGEGNALPASRFDGFPYAFRQLTIPHAGVSAARNAGLEAASADWVMFCDFDDTFAHIYALRDILHGLSLADAYDMLWTDLYIENGKTVPRQLIKKTHQDAVFTHGKLFRRDFLIKNGLRFNEALRFNEDSEFCAIFLAKCDYRRTGHLDTDAPPYVWCWREDSTTNREGADTAAAWGHFKRNLSVCRAFEENLPLPRYCAMVTRTVFDAYYTLNGTRLQPELVPMIGEFRKWYLAHRQYFGRTDVATLTRIQAVSRSECIRPDHDESLPIGAWLDQLAAGDELKE